MGLTAATSRPRLNTLALANLHSGLVVDGGCSHALLDLSCHCQECLLDVRCVLSGGLEEGDSEAIGKLLHQMENPMGQQRTKLSQVGVICVDMWIQ